MGIRFSVKRVRGGWKAPDIARIVAEAAHEVAAAAQLNAPVDTGALHDSIHARQVSDAEWEVVAPMDYAAAQEYGTRNMAGTAFMRPAVEEVRQGLKSLKG